MAEVTELNLQDVGGGASKAPATYVDLYKITQEYPAWAPYPNPCSNPPSTFYTSIERSYILSGGMRVKNEDIGKMMFKTGWVSPIRSPKPYEMMSFEPVTWYCVTPMNKTYGATHLQEKTVEADSTQTITDNQEIIVLIGSVEVDDVTTNAPCTVTGACTARFPVDSSYVVVTPTA
jgi:hypothetical protein